MSDIVTVYTTAPSEAEAMSIARVLVHERLVACANILPAGRSVYRWEGEVVDEEEIYLLFKTRADLTDAVVERIVALHRFEIPCIAVWPWAAGYRPYMEWVAGETGDSA